MRRVLLIGLLLGAACSEPDEGIFPGMLVVTELGYEPLTAPDTVQVGVELRFDVAGQGVVRVVGSRSKTWDDPVTVEKTVVVR